MKEDFLQYIWRTRTFDATNLRSTDGEHIEILQPGDWNKDAGPDFFNAKIRIGSTVWAGNVEIHMRSSEWYNHKHHSDDAYRNVVLHVVMDDDQPVRLNSGQHLPCLALRPRIPPNIIHRWFRLAHQRSWIPCAGDWPEIPDLIRNNWLERMLVERLEYKTLYISKALEDANNHWEDAFYHMLARHFGLRANTEPFEWLARATPRNTLVRHRYNPEQVQALLFGQAGMLIPPFIDDYPNSLAKEYRFLSHKYHLRPLDPAVWKFFRLRPAAFPTIRIAQLAALFQKETSLFNAISEASSIAEIHALFDVTADTYWDTHYRFDRPSPPGKKHLGTGFIRLLLVNLVAPTLFYHAQRTGSQPARTMAMKILESLPAESNSILQKWCDIGQVAGCAGQAQALLHLKKHYCDHRRCLECAIGSHLLK